MEEKKIPGHSARPHPAQPDAARHNPPQPESKKAPCLPNPRLDANFKGMFTKDCEDSHIALKSFLSAMIGEPVTDVIVRENVADIAEITGLPISDIEKLAEHA